ncbi:MAG TPA: DUF4843 domain-containing protein [Butyricimonas virosa]|uniref:DUF4843 domain-containing protein n=1 Tax=Butyricimonas virosa TaxID=544645 RepID=A0A921KXR0_9BACT|nr:DUF4843 domain-containing protein [Butyricimonas virosa]
MSRYILFFLLLAALGSCENDELMDYNSGHFLQWEMADSDSLEYSFSHYPENDELEVKLVLQLKGDLLKKAQNYRIEVVDSLTSALPGNYRLPEKPLFTPEQVVDTFSFVLVKSDALSTPVVLTLAIVANDYFMPGMEAYRYARIVFNNVPTKPLWWDDEMELYLGTYSPLKYEQFILCTKVNDLSGVDPVTLRKYALEFKAYIALNGITEANGDPMEIPIY